MFSYSPRKILIRNLESNKIDKYFVGVTKEENRKHYLPKLGTEEEILVLTMKKLKIYKGVL